MRRHTSSSRHHGEKEVEGDQNCYRRTFHYNSRKGTTCWVNITIAVIDFATLSLSAWRCNDIATAAAMRAFTSVIHALVLVISLLQRQMLEIMKISSPAPSPNLYSATQRTLVYRNGIDAETARPDSSSSHIREYRQFICRSSFHEHRWLRVAAAAATAAHHRSGSARRCHRSTSERYWRPDAAELPERRGSAASSGTSYSAHHHACVHHAKQRWVTPPSLGAHTS